MEERPGRATVSVPYRVAYRRDPGSADWCAIALEFNIMGFGTTPEKALKQLSELVDDYVDECVKYVARGEKVAFFQLADGNDFDFR